MLLNKITGGTSKGYDIQRITTAFEVADAAHKGQVRTSGESYISHPLAVACILVDLNMDTDSVCAALLHDVVEDTDITLDFLKKKFNSSVAFLVDGVTKIGKIPLYTSKENDAENIRKIIVSMS